jgi:hypothetical protein
VESAERGAANDPDAPRTCNTENLWASGRDESLPEVRIWEQRRSASSIAVLGDLAHTLTRPEMVSRNEDHVPHPLSTVHPPLPSVHCPLSSLSNPCSLITIPAPPVLHKPAGGAHARTHLYVPPRTRRYASQ